MKLTGNPTKKSLKLYISCVRFMSFFPLQRAASVSFCPLSSTSVTTLSWSGPWWTGSLSHKEHWREYIVDGAQVHHRGIMNTFAQSDYRQFRVANPSPGMLLEMEGNPCRHKEYMRKIQTDTGQFGKNCLLFFSIFNCIVSVNLCPL